MPQLEPVDVLIIGAGASGGAVAWSLAETRMNILCLEQGDWVKPTNYPSPPAVTGKPAQFADFAPARTGASAGPTIRSTTKTRRSKSLNFNAVGGSTILYAGHYPRLHPSDFRVKHAGRRRRRLADRLRDVGALLRRERPHDGRLRPGGRSGLSAEAAPMPPLPLGKLGDDARPRR